MASSNTPLSSSHSSHPPQNQMAPMPSGLGRSKKRPGGALPGNSSKKGPGQQDTVAITMNKHFGFDTNGRPRASGRDCPKHLANANILTSSMWKGSRNNISSSNCIVLLSRSEPAPADVEMGDIQSSGTVDNPSDAAAQHPPVLLALNDDDLTLHFQELQFSQNPGLCLFVEEEKVTEAYATATTATNDKGGFVKGFAFNFRRQRMELPGGRLPFKNVRYQTPTSKAVSKPTIPVNPVLQPSTTTTTESKLSSHITAPESSQRDKKNAKKDKKAAKKAAKEAEEAKAMEPKGLKEAPPATSTAKSVPTPEVSAAETMDAELSKLLLTALAELGVHGGTMDQYPDIITSIIKYSDRGEEWTATKRSFDITSWKYVQDPVSKPNYPASDKPEWVRDVASQFSLYNQVTVISTPGKKRMPQLVDHFNALMDKWDIHDGPWWAQRSYLSRETSIWTARPESWKQITPQFGLGMMFNRYVENNETNLRHEEWMVKRATNEYDLRANATGSVIYNTHRAQASFDDLDEVEYFWGISNYHELDFNRRVFNDFVGPASAIHDIQHDMTVNKTEIPNFVRLDISFNKSVGMMPPKFGAGQRLKLRDPVSYGNGLIVEWEGVVTEALNKTEDFVLLYDISKQRGPGRLEAGQQRSIYIEAEPNEQTFMRNLDAIRNVVRTKNPWIKELLLNNGYDSQKTPVKLNPAWTKAQKSKKTQKSRAGDQPEIPKWIPTEVIKPGRLSEEQQQRLDAFHADATLNPKQKQLVREVIDDRRGLSLVLGPPGNGKTKTVAGAIYETALYGKTVLAVASTNAAKDALAEQLLKVIKFLPEKKKSMVVLCTPGTLKQSWKSKEKDLDHLVKSLETFNLTSNSQEDRDALDPTKLAYYRLGACINRFVAQQIDDDNNPQRDVYLEWKVTRDNIANGTARVSAKTRENFNELTDWIIKTIIEQTKIVVSTCSNASYPTYLEAMGHRNLIVQDEAAFALPAETAILLNISHDMLLLAGDHEQLEPVTLSDRHNEYSGYLKLSFFAAKHQVGWPIIQLNMNYRMHPDIAEFSSITVPSYKGVRNASNTMREHPVNKWFEDFTTHNELGKQMLNALQRRPDDLDKVSEGRKMHRFGVNVPTAYAHGKDGSTSITCYELINMAVRMLVEFLKYTPSGHGVNPLQTADITILDPYSLDRGNIAKQLHHLGGIYAQVRVQVVDGFQGGEAPIVFLLLPSAHQNNGGHVGFQKNPNRLNVALTRALQYLFIFGNFNLWHESLVQLHQKAPQFALMVTHLTGKGNVIDATLIDTNVGNDMKSKLPNTAPNSKELLYWQSQSIETHPTRRAKELSTFRQKAPIAVLMQNEDEDESEDDDSQRAKGKSKAMTPEEKHAELVAKLEELAAWDMYWRKYNNAEDAGKDPSTVLKPGQQPPEPEPEPNIADTFMGNLNDEPPKSATEAFLEKMEQSEDEEGDEGEIVEEEEVPIGEAMEVD